VLPPKRFGICSLILHAGRNGVHRSVGSSVPTASSHRFPQAASRQFLDSQCRSLSLISSKAKPGPGVSSAFPQRLTPWKVLGKTVVACGSGCRYRPSRICSFVSPPSDASLGSPKQSEIPHQFHDRQFFGSGLHVDGCGEVQPKLGKVTHVYVMSVPPCIFRIPTLRR
jgi:hypothetical protein